MSSVAAPANLRSEQRIARREALALLARSKAFIVGVLVIAFWIVCAIFGFRIAPHDPLGQSASVLHHPSWSHPFGTDALGRDVLSRVLAGARDITRLAPVATLLAVVAGTGVGLTIGYFRGVVDDIVSRIIEALLSLPGIVLTVTIIVALGRSPLTLILVVAFGFTPIIARTVRAAVLGERDLEYVQAARLRGERAPWIMFAEILPNVTGTIVVEATVRLGYAIFAVASLTFLGFGVQPPSPDWSLQIAENYGLLSAGSYWWTVLFPAAAIASLVVAVNLVADAIAQGATAERPPRVASRVRPRRRAFARPRSGSHATPAPEHALEVRDLDVAYQVRGRDRQVLRDLSFGISRGESYGLVGESGCGKSTAALAIARYLPQNGRVRGGSIKLDGRDVLRLTNAELRRVRADAVGMVYQNPGTALNPSIRVGKQVAEVFAVRGAARGDALDRARTALATVQIADPDSVLRRYPHQLSGGMQQRVVIAMALAKDPALLILDEPTTGLDATVEAEVLDLIAQLQAEFRTSVLFISHNLGVIAKMCERVGVLYAGRLVEEGPVEAVLHDPRHPYTVGLLRCIPSPGVRKDYGPLDTIPGFLPHLGEQPAACVFADRCALAQEICRRDEPAPESVGPAHTSRCHFHERAHDLPRAEPAVRTLRPIERGTGPVVAFDHLRKDFRQRGHDVHALTGVSATIWPGETLGLVGESGSGKTTLARALLGLVEPTSGSVELAGKPLASRLARRTDAEVRALQIVFQNPDAALNRRHTVRRILRRALKKLAGLTGTPAERRLHELLRAVRVADRYVNAHPGQLSGGLKQRVAIARAFAGAPQLVVCDEPTSSLDVSVQAAILNLLVELQAAERVAYLFISHDLGVVRYLADRIAVMYLGRLLELGPAETVFAGPHHPYTEALLSAVPTLHGDGRDRIRLMGEIPSAANPPSGCVFHTRCHRKLGEICEIEQPPLIEVEPGHLMSCHIPIDELRRLCSVPPDADQRFNQTRLT